jgi:hypothetical protein
MTKEGGWKSLDFYGILSKEDLAKDIFDDHEKAVGLCEHYDNS